MSVEGSGPLVRAKGEGFEPLRWEAGGLRLLDQRRLPDAVVEWLCPDEQAVAEAIRTLAVRGAPLIGVAAGYGLALAAQRIVAGDAPGAVAGPGGERHARLAQAAALLAGTRPTAVNLFWAIERMLARAGALVGAASGAWAAGLLDEARALHEEDRRACAAIGAHGAALVPPGARILTHCNAGALATAGVGTALGVLRAAFARDPSVRFYADETRPLLQGARLTAWELEQDGLPVTLLTDSMAGFAMARKMIDLVVVGADRIAANGDTANKIGTYSVAVLARHHGLPLYVAAPDSTFDLSLDHGGQIPIEERQADELRRFAGAVSAPAEVAVWNPAFDVTPGELIAGIIGERGVARPPYRESLPRLLGRG